MEVEFRSIVTDENDVLYVSVISAITQILYSTYIRNIYEASAVITDK